MSKTQNLDQKRELSLWCTYANDHGGLPVPFVEEVVDGVLDDGGIAPVVLGQDEDEGGVFLDLLAPGTAVRLGVFGVVGDLGGEHVHGSLPSSRVDWVSSRCNKAFCSRRKNVCPRWRRGDGNWTRSTLGGIKLPPINQGLEKVIMRPHIDPRMLHSCRLIKFEAFNRDQVARWPIGRSDYMQLVC